MRCQMSTKMTHEELHEIVSEATTLPGDLAPAPKAWRRFLPAWLRALLWVDVADRYDAFLSYSWRCDRDIASVVQSVMQRFLCPWYKVRAKKIFCDLACLPAGSSLEAELFSRLDRSLHLIVLASPELREAAEWKWKPVAGSVGSAMAKFWSS